MITQHFTIDDCILTCPGCGARLTENRLEHRDRCEFTAGVAAAERERIVAFLTRVSDERDPSGPAPELQEMCAGALMGAAVLIREQP